MFCSLPWASPGPLCRGPLWSLAHGHGSSRGRPCDPFQPSPFQLGKPSIPRLQHRLFMLFRCRAHSRPDHSQQSATPSAALKSRGPSS